MTDRVALLLSLFGLILGIAVAASQATLWLAKRFERVEDRLQSLNRRLNPIESWFRNELDREKAKR